MLIKLLEQVMSTHIMYSHSQGTLKLTPGTDIWQDTTQLPEVRINREGNFDAIQSAV